MTVRSIIPGKAQKASAIIILTALLMGCEQQLREDQVPIHRPATFNIAGKSYDVFHPPGFKLELVNRHLSGPRILHFHGDRIFIGSKSGNVYWLDPPYDKVNILVQMDDYPHSVAVRDEFIYIAQTGGVYRSPYSGQPRIESSLFEKFVNLPGGSGHTSRTLKLGPDNALFVSIGINGNCSDQYLDPSYPEFDRRGGIHRIDESGPKPKLVPYASGLRNPVGFDWHPDSDVMYASNNGPDHLGFHQPPEYFSKLDAGSFHGMPWFQYDGESVIQDECIESDPPRPINDVQLPVATFPSRNAPLGITFVPEHAKATEFHGDAIVALHGSWGTTNKGSHIGPKSSRRHPKLVRVDFVGESATSVHDLLTGFQLEDGERWLRPADVAIGPDGDIYFTSDDNLEGLYRLRKL